MDQRERLIVENLLLGDPSATANALTAAIQSEDLDLDALLVAVIDLLSEADDAVSLLIARGADPTACDTAGRSALDLTRLRDKSHLQPIMLSSEASALWEPHGLPLPPLLIELIQDGVWPVRDRRTQDSTPLVDRALAERFGHSLISLATPIFKTAVRYSSMSSERLPFSHLWDEVDPACCLMIADMGLGADTPIFLHYHDCDQPPRVITSIYPIGPYREAGFRWTELAADFAYFARILGLDNNGPFRWVIDRTVDVLRTQRFTRMNMAIEVEYTANPVRVSWTVGDTIDSALFPTVREADRAAYELKRSLWSTYLGENPPT